CLAPAESRLSSSAANPASHSGQLAEGDVLPGIPITAAIPVPVRVAQERVGAVSQAVGAAARRLAARRLANRYNRARRCLMVQIRIAKDLDNHVRATAGAMTVDELLARFPEVPRDLQAEPVLKRYVAAFGPLLRVAQKPSPCVGAGGD